MTADGGPSQSDELWLQSLLITGLVLTYRTKSALGVLAWLNRGGTWLVKCNTGHECTVQVVNPRDLVTSNLCDRLMAKNS